MRYKPKNVSALHVAIGGLPDKMHAEADPGLGVSAKTIGDLRKMMAWPENLVITVPQEHPLAGAIKISKANVIERISPKPNRTALCAWAIPHRDWLLAEAEHGRAKLN